MTTDKTKNFFRVSAENFKKIPGSPIAYWLSNTIVGHFANDKTISAEMITREGMATSNNDLFMRLWPEVASEDIDFLANSSYTKDTLIKRWYPYNKGGSFRRWYGNDFFVVNWQNDGEKIKASVDSNTGRIRSHNYNGHYAFKPGITWSAISSGTFSARVTPKGFLFDSKGAKGFTKEINFYLAILNSITSNTFLTVLAPTLDYKVGDIIKIPVQGKDKKPIIITLTNSLVSLSKSDWDSYETSWNFQENPLIRETKKTAIPSKAERGFLINNGEERKWIGASQSLADTYIMLRRQWQSQTEEMRRLEIENNRIFIDAYALQDELSPEVPWNEITLTCNPWYRYGKKLENFNIVGKDFALVKKERIEISPVNNNDSDARPSDSFPFAKDIEERLLEDTIKEFISYAVGCMMGRYSPEKPGLILANQGDNFLRYHEIISDKTAEEISITRDNITSQHHVICDSDGVIPILDEEWFADDIVAQFKDFLKLTFGTEHFTENLEFVKKALGKDIRKYFIKDFYKDHVQHYKKRPIYWMFSSPKGSFNALIYLHRYQPDTVSIVLNEYLREFMTKLRVQREHLISNNNRTDLASAEKTRNMKLIDKYAAMLAELEAYERDVLFPLAQKQIAIDLDDGVKVNYVKFGDALKKIPGLEAKEK